MPFRFFHCFPEFTPSGIKKHGMAHPRPTHKMDMAGTESRTEGLITAGFEKDLKAMAELFARDHQFALAAAANDVPSLRFIDTYLYEAVFMP